MKTFSRILIRHNVHNYYINTEKLFSAAKHVKHGAIVRRVSTWIFNLRRSRSRLIINKRMFVLIFNVWVFLQCVIALRPNARRTFGTSVTIRHF